MSETNTKIGNYTITDVDIDTFISGMPQEQQMYRGMPEFRKQCEERLEEICLFAMYGEEEKKDETDPQKLVEKLSSVKAEDVAGCFPAGTLVIGADTVVSIVKDGESDPVILGKPGTVEKAEEMISLIQGRTHQVYTGVTVILCLGADRFAETTFAEKADVEVYEMAEDEIRAYAASGEPLDKAGAYGIQGSFAAYIKGIKGDYSNVVGLPLGRLCHEIKRLLEEREND